MKIHHVAPHFHPEKGGAESNLLGLARYAANQGHEVIVHTSALSTVGEVLPRTDSVGRVAIRRYRPSVHLGYYVTLFRPDVRGADIVHLHGYGFLTNDRVAAAIRGSIPIVYSLLHGVAQSAPSLRVAWERAVYDALQGRKTLRRAAAIVATSVPDREWLEARGFSPERVHVVPAGLDPEAFEAGSADRARAMFRIDRYVVFVGRLHREKSPDHLLRAIAALPDWVGSLVLAGPDGGERTHLERLASGLRLRDRVVFAGEVDEKTKRDLLAGAECLVLPSFYESQGIAILEAWAQGIPVVASRVGGVPFLVAHGVDGLLYDWGDVAALRDALRRILHTRTEAGRMGQAGREKVRAHFTWDVLAPRIEAIYERLRSP